MPHPEPELRVKAEPMDPDPRFESARRDAEEEMGEKGIKDWKPDVDVTYKGQSTRLLPTYPTSVLFPADE